VHAGLYSACAKVFFSVVFWVLVLINAMHRRWASSNIASLTLHTRILKVVTTTVKYNDRSRAQLLTNNSGTSCFIIFAKTKHLWELYFHLNSFFDIVLISTFFFLSHSHWVWNMHTDFQIHCIIISWLTFYLFICSKKFV
jgi:hypothetical protein